LHEVAIQEPMRLFFHHELPGHRPLAGQELPDLRSEGTLIAIQLPGHRTSSTVATGDGARGFDGHLAVNLRGGGAVTDRVSDDFQVEVGIDRPLDTGVSERMRHGAWDTDADLVQLVGGAR
jgi:hypothetical protein